jgi:hypothetical protein
MDQIKEKFQMYPGQPAIEIGSLILGDASTSFVEMSDLNG